MLAFLKQFDWMPELDVQFDAQEVHTMNFLWVCMDIVGESLVTRVVMMW
jgi:hypothetical protein